MLSHQQGGPGGNASSDSNPASRQQQRHLLSDIAVLRSQLDAKIRAAKSQLETLTSSSSREQVQQPPPLQVEPASLRPTGTASGGGGSGSSGGTASGRRELHAKIEKVRLDLDLLLARQRSLQAQRLQQQQEQQQKQQQQKRRPREGSTVGAGGVSASPGSTRWRALYSSKYSLRRRVFRHQRLASNGTGSAAAAAVGTAVRSATSGASRTLTTAAAANAPAPVRRSRSLVERAKFRLRRKRVYCVYYCRSGHCRKGQACRYLHDANKVAICRRFLKHGGVCTEPQCRLSHCLDPDKLPLCEFHDTPAGCQRRSCPYRHATFPPGTAACPRFRLLGHCPAGARCRLRHVWPTQQQRVRRSRSSSGGGAQLQKSAAAASASASGGSEGGRCPAFIPLKARSSAAAKSSGAAADSADEEEEEDFDGI